MTIPAASRGDVYGLHPFHRARARLGEIRVSDYKPISYMKKYPDAVEVQSLLEPRRELNVFASSSLHFAPVSATTPCSR